MTQWYRKLYRGEKDTEFYHQIVRAINDGKFQMDAYVIALPANPQDVFDLIPVNMLPQPYYTQSILRILGVAADREEAIEIVRKIVQETVDTTGGVNIRARFREEDFW